MKKELLILGSIIVSGHLYADNSIYQANNQVYLNGEFVFDHFRYGDNHPADSGAPLYNASTHGLGAQMGINKTFGSIYGNVIVDANRNVIEYVDSTIPSPLSDASSVNLNVAAKLGYFIDFCNTTALTPYILGGYFSNQLNTGGFRAPFLAANFDGATFITNTFYYGVGVLGQWAIMPKLVFSLDLQVGTQSNPQVKANVTNFNTQPQGVTVYQRWNPSSKGFWQANLGGDYLATEQLHVLAGVNYYAYELGSTTSNSTGVFPFQKHYQWSGNLGLGYSFAPLPNCDELDTTGDINSILAVNNQGAVHLFAQAQEFEGGVVSSFNQGVGTPYMGISFTKTWPQVFTQLAVKDAFDNTSHQALNTIYDANGKLGYMFDIGCTMAATPYATLGFHRSLVNHQGEEIVGDVPNGINRTYYIDGSLLTYQHSYYGLGVLFQGAITPQFVINADINGGRSFNARMYSWWPQNFPLNTSYQLGDNYYVMASVGGDYRYYKNWHTSLSVNYSTYHYTGTQSNIFGLNATNARFAQLSIDLGFGYSFI